MLVWEASSEGMHDLCSKRNRLESQQPLLCQSAFGRGGVREGVWGRAFPRWSQVPSLGNHHFPEPVGSPPVSHLPSSGSVLGER